MTKSFISEIYIEKIENSFANNCSRTNWVVRDKFNSFKIPISNYKLYYFEINKKYHIININNKLIKLHEIFLFVNLFILILLYAFFRNPIIALLTLLIGIIYLLFEVICYYRKINNVKMIKTIGIILDISYEKKEDSDFYFNSLLIKYETKDKVELIERTKNSYTFLDSRIKGINIKSNDTIIIKYDSSIPEYVWWIKTK